MTRDIEIWKDVDDYEGYYQVSNKGRLRSLDRMITVKRIGWGPTPIKGRIKRITSDGKGYFHVGLSRNRITKVVKIHILVAKAFIHNPDNKPEINHKDCNKRNNNVSNLEWATRRENVDHAMKHGLLRSLKGEAHPNSKLTKTKVRNIRKLMNDGATHNEVAITYGVCMATISEIKHRKIWAHI